MIWLGNWFKNFAQVDWKQLTPQNLADVEAPRLEYAIYWTLKSVQAGSFIGGIVVHPIYRFYLSRQLKPETTTSNSTKIIRNQCRRIQGRFFLASMAIGPALSLLIPAFNGWDQKTVADKCYAIRCNGNALIWDRSTAFFAFIGWYWKRFQGAVDGVNLSLVYTIAYLSAVRDYTTPFMVDKIKPEERLSSVLEGSQNRSALTRFLTTLDEMRK